jgi:hypothetical protein
MTFSDEYVLDNDDVDMSTRNDDDRLEDESTWYKSTTTCGLHACRKGHKLRNDESQLKRPQTHQPTHIHYVHMSTCTIVSSAHYAV